MNTISKWHNVKLRTVFFAVTYLIVFNVLRAEELEANISPIAVISTDKDHVAVKKFDKWIVDANRDLAKKLRSIPIENQYRLDDADMLILKRCLKEFSCETSLSMKNLMHVDYIGEKNVNASLDVTIQKLSPEIFVAIEKTYVRTATIIHAGSGEVVPQFQSSTISAIDTRMNQVIYSVCTASIYECDLFSTDLHGRDKHLIVRAQYGIVDMVFKKGILYGLAKTPNKKFHVSSSLLGWSGHAPSYEDWYMLEIDTKTGEIKESSLIKNAKNGAGFFPNKWMTQSE